MLTYCCYINCVTIVLHSNSPIVLQSRMSAGERDVFRFINQENQEWLKTLRIMTLKKESSPGSFLYNLCQFLFPEVVFPELNEEARKLEHIRRLFAQFKIKSIEHWSPMLVLSGSGKGDGDKAQRATAIAEFNTLLKNLRFYFTFDQELRKTLKGNLKERKEICEQLARELEAVACENEFYRSKLERIEALIASRGSSSDAQKAKEILSEYIE